MGVPKFYRWVSERYPCLSEVVKEYQIPEFDNLYLDMNGIVHVCSHPEDDNPHFRITEEKIYQDIFHYIEVLFRMIKPKKVFFMAIDGVAPRAKMNQQRGRRFRSAKEAEDLVRQALQKGEVLPSEERFDSNCITPGTEFMAKLQEQLKYFVVKKQASDPTWQQVNVILSGHETPGEGEHKVMDFIRYQKSQSDYDHNTRHCLYGLDADLMMLALASHEPHFSLLREEVRFGGKNQQKRSTAPEETTFHLLHISLFREYLDFEFKSLSEPGVLSFPYDIERIIDDWVLMGFLVGNDFIPHLPHMHINTDCLPMLWGIYMEVLPTIDGYLQDNGTINLKRLEVYLAALAKHDIENFSDQYADIKWLESKKGGKAFNEEAAQARMKKSATVGAEMSNIPEASGEVPKGGMKKSASIGTDMTGIPTANDFMVLKTLEDGEEEDLMKAMGGMTLEEYEEGLDEEDQVDWGMDPDELFQAEFRQHKNAYYMTKLEYSKVTPEVLKEQAHGYVKALQWILYYYYHGVPSWSWFYEHHYAPYLSDIKDFADMEMKFDLNTPFLPFQQLMAVLPAASKNLMPKPLQGLMISDTSPVIDFYPQEFEQDLNGKLQAWEAVVKIPFIDEKRLLAAMKPLEAKLTDEEKARNKHGPHMSYCYSEKPNGTYYSPLPDSPHFPDIVNCHSRIKEIHKDLYRIPVKDIHFGLMEKVKLDLFFPGFPTLKHLKHTACLKKEGVKVFQQNSRGYNMILELDWEEEEPDLEEVANEYLGQNVWVQWPHLQEVRVIGISNDSMKYSLVEDRKSSHKTRSAPKDPVEIERHDMDRGEITEWHKRVGTITETYHGRRGVDIGPTHFLLEACTMTGRKYMCGHHGNITLEKQWSAQPVHFAFQTSVKDLAVQDPSFAQFKTLDQLFAVKAPVFMLGWPHYGCLGEVLEIDPKNEGRIRVEFSVPQEPDLSYIIRHKGHASQRYLLGYQVAQQLGIDGHLVSRITGSMMMYKGSKKAPKGNDTNRINIGFNLKFNRSQNEVPGYTRKDPERNQWMYSREMMDIIADYIEKFPELFDFISSHESEDLYYEEDIFGAEKAAQRVKELREFIKSQACSSVAPASFGSRTCGKEVIGDIEEAVDNLLSQAKKKKKVKMQVRPHLLYRPLDAQTQIQPDTSAEYMMFDRVINVREGYSVPLGLRGTVIGIISAEKERDIVYEVLFDEAFLGGLTLRCSPSRAYRMPATALVNITYGVRKHTSDDSKPTAIVHPQQPSRNQYGSYSAAANQSNYQSSQGSYSQMRQNQRGHYQENRGQHRNQQFNNQDQGGHRGHRGQGPRQGHGQGQGQRGGQGRNQQSRQQQKQEQDDFANIWNQLQASTEAVLGQQSKSGQQTRAGPSQGPSLTEAALSLPKTQQQQQAGGNRRNRGSKNSPPKNTNQNAQSSQGGGAGMQKISLNQLFSGATPGDSASIGAQSAHDTNEEFSNLLQCLQTGGAMSQPPANQQPANQQAGTAALQQMLNIGGGQQQQPYGKQVSVEQLFQEVSNKQQQIQQHQHQQQQQQQQQQQRYNKQKHQPQKRNAVTDLQNHCVVHKLGQPNYRFQGGRDNKMVAFVEIGNRMTFKGSYCRNEQQAAESVASVALMELQGTNQQGQQFSSSPNSAFRPVGKPPSLLHRPPPPLMKQQPPFFVPGWQQHVPPPFPAGMPPPNFQGGGSRSWQQMNNQMPSTWLSVGTNQQQQQQHGQRNQQYRNQQPNKSQQQPLREVGERPANEKPEAKTPSKVNAFVPTQVQLKQKTPQREVKESSEDTSVPLDSGKELNSAQKKLFESLSMGSSQSANTAPQPLNVDQTKNESTKNGESSSQKEKQQSAEKAKETNNSEERDTVGKKLQQVKEKSVDKETPPTKRPRSRLAANFGGGKK